MLALTLDMAPLPQFGTPVIAYRHEAPFRPSESRRAELTAICYQAGNALTTARQRLEFGKKGVPEYMPRTELGKKLLALRQAYVANGGRLLSADALDEELHSRRGGVSDD
jgi:hypothetical protein